MVSRSPHAFGEYTTGSKIAGSMIERTETNFVTLERTRTPSTLHDWLHIVQSQ